MLKQAEKSVLQGIMAWTPLLTTLIVTPWFSYDPINLPKLAVISFGAFLGLGVLVTNFCREWLVAFRNQIIIIGLLILDLTLVLVFSGNNFYQEFFGTSGRATGYVAYTSLAILFLGALVVSGVDLAKRLTLMVLVAGFFSIFYGVLQSLKFDPVNWGNLYTANVGFLGNPNFQSSFVGFSGIIAFAYLMQNPPKWSQRIGLLSYLIIASYVISATQSQQGFLVLIGGIGIVFLIWMKSSKFARLIFPVTFTSALGVLITILGIFNKGPLASLLYKPSVTFRVDYWKAGWEMTVEHPISGIGLDSYGDWYQRERTLESILRRGPGIWSNAAHNVFLDFSSNGGFPLLVIYLVLTALVIKSIVRILRRSTGFDATLAGLIAMWIAYQSQSIFSLNQLGLAVWGWIISGALIGYEINTRSQSSVQTVTVKQGIKKLRTKSVPTNLSSRTILGLFCFAIVGFLLSVAPLMASAKYLTALKSQDSAKIEQAAFLWPPDSGRADKVAILLFTNNLNTQALRVLIPAVKKFPDDFSLWNVFSQLPNATPEQKAEAKAQMKRLDPLNPELK